MAKHTPGPWIVFQDCSEHPGIEAPECRQTVVLFGGEDDDETAGIQGETMEEAHANARLIAAAPDLLEALQEGLALKGGWRAAIVELEDWCSERVILKTMLAAADQLDRWAEHTRAAIAKATQP